jgi:cyclophilin family peptidyl-prolyl cis-trans isomerase
MFKGQNKTWLYLIGVLLMFGILILMTRNFTIPVFWTGEKDFEIPRIGTSKPTFTIDTNLDYLAIIKTNKGDILLDLFEKNAPNNTNNFIYLSQLKYYDGTKFHRLIANLLVQGGDRNTLDSDTENDGKGRPSYVIDDEINLDTIGLDADRIEQIKDRGFESNTSVQSIPLRQYSLAMANDGPDTNGSQFFIILANTEDSRLKQMNGTFTVIGEVISGFDTLKIIENTPVDNPNFRTPTPQEDLIVNTVEILVR